MRVDFVDVIKELQDATAAYKEAMDLCAEARKAETNALNKLNEAQKAFDAVLAKQVQESAVYGSAWHSTSVRKASEKGPV